MTTGFIIVFSLFVLMLVFWNLMVVSSRKYYEEIRDNANIETEKELIDLCNQALDQANATRMFYYKLWRRVKGWLS